MVNFAKCFKQIKSIYINSWTIKEVIIDNIAKWVYVMRTVYTFLKSHLMVRRQ